MAEAARPAYPAAVVAAVVAAAAAGVAAAAGGGPMLRFKHDIALLGHLDNGLGYYRFSYVGSDRAYVGVMAQEVQTIMPEAVVRGRDGYLAGLLRQARPDVPDLRPVDRIGRTGPDHHRVRH